MKAIISLTTIPDRINHIKPTIESLLKQGLPVYLWAVRKIERSETYLEEVPEWLRKSKVNVRIVRDRGPITKLLPALDLDVEQIITADDDHIYGDGWADTLLKWSRRRKHNAIAFRGRKLTGNGYSGSKRVVYKKIDKPQKVHIITGVFGALYRKDFFYPDFVDWWKKCPTNDDLVIAAYLKKLGVPSYVVPGKVRIKHTKLQWTEPLFDVNRVEGDSPNDRWVKELGLE